MHEPLAEQGVCRIKLLKMSGTREFAIKGAYDLVDAPQMS
jgi:hypothetical protein